MAFPYKANGNAFAKEVKAGPGVSRFRHRKYTAYAIPANAEFFKKTIRGHTRPKKE
jgi:hypothetical protein